MSLTMSAPKMIWADPLCRTCIIRDRAASGDAAMPDLTLQDFTKIHGWSSAHQNGDLTIGKPWENHRKMVVY